MNKNNVRMPMHALIEQFLEQLWAEDGLTQNTRAAYGSDLLFYAQWLTGRQHDFQTVTETVLSEYALFLQNDILEATESDTRKPSSLARHFSSLRRFHLYLLHEKMCSQNPAQHLPIPKQPKRLPKALTEAEVKRLLTSPDLTQDIELRDKAMLEVLYATGLRISELISLTTYMLDLERGVVRILGKGNKERLVPLGEEAVYWLIEYLKKSRPALLKQKTTDTVFISKQGKPITRQTFWYRIKQYAVRAEITQDVSPHMLRHAFATHLINHGADLRVVQLLLGHSDLSSTQIYTHVATHRLKNLHSKHHPRA